MNRSKYFHHWMVAFATFLMRTAISLEVFETDDNGTTETLLGVNHLTHFAENMSCHDIKNVRQRNEV
jgi:hypothetical protein